MTRSEEAQLLYSLAAYLGASMLATVLLLLGAPGSGFQESAEDRRAAAPSSHFI